MVYGNKVKRSYVTGAKQDQDIAPFEKKLHFVFICCYLGVQNWGIICLNEEVYKSTRYYKSQIVRRPNFSN